MDEQTNDAKQVEPEITTEALEKRYLLAYTKALEHISGNFDMIDPEDRFVDDITHERWIGIGTGGDRERVVPYTDEQGLTLIREQNRLLAARNEYAINGLENRINYVVGTGHSYTVAPKRGKKISDKVLADTQQVIDDFIIANRWHARQQDISLRNDRDGECFLRFFVQAKGTLKVRFVEPWQVRTPESQSSNLDATFGILTDEDDIETILTYFVDGEQIDASEIQHRKENVDINSKRGLPLFYPVRRDLSRVEVINKNMAEMTAILSAIAMIRKHKEATSGVVDTMLKSNADVTATNPTTGKETHFKRYAPGTILDAPDSIEYQFPSHQINPGVFVQPRDAILQTAAARLVMPEFMLTSNAANANFSSTLVAEGPAVKMFQRLQWTMIEADLEVMWRVVNAAIDAGLLPASLRDELKIDAEPPRVASRDRLKEVQADDVLVKAEAMSIRTLQLRNDLDPEVEDANMGKERDTNPRTNPFAGGFPDDEEEPEVPEPEDLEDGDEETD